MRLSPSRCALFCVYVYVFFVLNPVDSVGAFQDTPAASLLAGPARAWALDCANNEVLVMQHPNSYLRYRLHTVDGKGDQVRDQIETPEGTVSRLIQRDGRALTQAEDSAERDRLNSLAASPALFARHVRHDEDNRKTGIGMIKMMPDAMLWSYSPGQPQLPNRAAGDPALIVLDFKPNPGWSPPNLESELLTGLAGRVWIDPRSRTMVRLEATLIHAVNIGWGMLAHIYPGGTATLEQTNAGGQRWVMQRIVEQLAVQALMVKNVKQRLISDAADFQPVAPMNYRQAIKILLDTPLPAR
ncbi:MAG: hypothetical protein ABSG84_01125 [Acidobacteriaceae bacterium]